MLQLGERPLVTYYPIRAYANELKALLTPKSYVDWMCLHLYLDIFMKSLSTSKFAVGHVPWDLIDLQGLKASASIDDVMKLFSSMPYYYPSKWVSTLICALGCTLGFMYCTLDCTLEYTLVCTLIHTLKIIAFFLHIYSWLTCFV